MMKEALTKVPEVTFTFWLGGNWWRRSLYVHDFRLSG